TKLKDKKDPLEGILKKDSNSFSKLNLIHKLVFHFQTLLDNFERTVIDDSRLAGRPAEIFVGKMFKMEVWETLLTSMRIGEVAEFWCDAVHTGLYPIVSKGMRLIAQGKDPLEGQRHMCGMGNMFHYHSTGFPELDELMRTPQPLIFIMELLQVRDPMSYHRESWMMEKDEKLQTVPTLHMQGNALVKQRRFSEAASKYKEAVLLLKTVQSKEMPGDIDYINLGRMIVPLELNYCQCMLELEEYYEVIEHTTELLEKHKGKSKSWVKYTCKDFYFLITEMKSLHYSLFLAGFNITGVNFVLLSFFFFLHNCTKPWSCIALLVLPAHRGASDEARLFVTHLSDKGVKHQTYQTFSPRTYKRKCREREKKKLCWCYLCKRAITI
uniref:Aryl hydrocarbon receptor interacting protein like 2 n=1 Tax=Salarias fasciatus TaxID=181472 RepID=A0A672JD42_SALFA